MQTLPNQTSAAAAKIPAGLWALTVSAFAIGTTELVVVGLLPTLSMSLKISVSHTGSLVTFYALGVAIGGPLITALTGKIPRKRLLLGVMLLFMAGHIMSAIAIDYFTLILSRILCGFSHGVFFGVGATIAGNLVTPDRKATAISIMFAGLTVAMVIGVPLGTFIGQHMGWRATFLGIALLGAVGFFANLILLPDVGSNAQPLRLSDQFSILKKRSITLVLLVTVLAFAGTFTTFTYISMLLYKVSGFSQDEITVLLLVYGVAIVLGNLIGGRVANKNPARALIIMFLLQAMTLLSLAFSAPHPLVAEINLFLMGILAFSNVPGLQFYIVQLAHKYAPGTHDVASALNIAAFNVGIALGAFIGGITVDSSLGVKATPVIGAMFVILGLIGCMMSRNKERIPGSDSVY